MNAYKEKRMGSVASFLVPSLKMKQKGLRLKLEKMLLKEFKGFTVTGGMISGSWIDDHGRTSHGEHQEYKIAIGSKAKILKRYLAELAKELNEKWLYLEVEGKAFFISSL